MVPNRLGVVLVATFLLLVLLPGPAGSQAGPLAVCSNPHEGSLVVPTGTENPPWPLILFTPQIGDIWVHAAELKPVGWPTTFYLWASSGGSGTTEQLPDFNIQFYASNGSPLGPTYNAVGPVTGTVPVNADHGIVWMRTGPDVPPDDNPFGAEFIYRDGCSGAPNGWPG